LLVGFGHRLGQRHPLSSPRCHFLGRVVRMRVGRING